jgi:hypothetical protein
MVEPYLEFRVGSSSPKKPCLVKAKGCLKSIDFRYKKTPHVGVL